MGGQIGLAGAGGGDPLHQRVPRLAGGGRRQRQQGAPAGGAGPWHGRFQLVEVAILEEAPVQRCTADVRPALGHRAEAVEDFAERGDTAEARQWRVYGRAGQLQVAFDPEVAGGHPQRRQGGRRRRDRDPLAAGIEGDGRMGVQLELEAQQDAGQQPLPTQPLDLGRGAEDVGVGNLLLLAERQQRHPPWLQVGGGQQQRIGAVAADQGEARRFGVLATGERPGPVGVLVAPADRGLDLLLAFLGTGEHRVGHAPVAEPATAGPGPAEPRQRRPQEELPVLEALAHRLVELDPRREDGAADQGAGVGLVDEQLAQGKVGAEHVPAALGRGAEHLQRRRGPGQLRLRFQEPPERRHGRRREQVVGVEEEEGLDLRPAADRLPDAGVAGGGDAPVGLAQEAHPVGVGVAQRAADPRRLRVRAAVVDDHHADAEGGVLGERRADRSGQVVRLLPGGDDDRHPHRRGGALAVAQAEGGRQARRAPGTLERAFDGPLKVGPRGRSGRVENVFPVGAIEGS